MHEIHVKIKCVKTARKLSNVFRGTTGIHDIKMTFVKTGRKLSIVCRGMHGIHVKTKEEGRKTERSRTRMWTHQWDLETTTLGI